jgi:hypothetical protein
LGTGEKARKVKLLIAVHQASTFQLSAVGRETIDLHQTLHVRFKASKYATERGLAHRNIGATDEQVSPFERIKEIAMF